MNVSPVFLAFLLTVLAGLATGLGSMITLVSKRTSPRFLSLSLGFSAGVMIFVSLVELFGEARHQLSALWGARGGMWGAVGGFFGGMALIALIDRLVPPAVNPHEARAKEAARHEAVDSHSCDDTLTSRRGAKLLRTGALTALGFILSGVAGIMIYISLDELLPSAHEYGKSHLAGLAGGMGIMAVSLALGIA